MLEQVIIVTVTVLALLAVGVAVTVASIVLLDGVAVFRRNPPGDKNQRQHL
jgi:hypothetical protein